MSKLWCIALAFDDKNTGSLVLTTRLAPSAEIAIAMAVSQFYTDNPGVRLPLASIATLEMTRKFMEERLKAMDEVEANPDPVVRLVPPPYASVILNKDYPRRIEEVRGTFDEDDPAA